MSVPFEAIRRLCHQLYYTRSGERKASIMHKLFLRLKYDCFISRKADIYHVKKIKMGANVQVFEYAMLNFKSGYDIRTWNIEIGDNTKVLPHSKIIPQQGFVRIGRNCTIQYGCLLYGVGGLEIGDDVRMGAYTVVTPMEHIYDDLTVPIWHQGERAQGIRIGNDVWIGNSVKILDGVDIGDGCVIGAGSVVTRSLPPASVAVGVPANVIKMRGG